MSGETNLDVLLNTMTATLEEGIYVFITSQHPITSPGFTPRMMFQETGGVTYIALEEQAKSLDIPYEFPCRMITLNVHSSLEAVGFIARIATTLAAAGMGVNPVSGFYHDHLFVPNGREEAALKLLAQLAQNSAP